MLPFAVHSAGVHGPGAHRISRENMQNRRDGVGEKAMKFPGLKLVSLGSGWCLGRPFGGPCHLAVACPCSGAFEPIAADSTGEVSEMFPIGTLGRKRQFVSF